MKKSTRNTGKRQEIAEKGLPELGESGAKTITADLLEMVISAGLEAVNSLIEEEITKLCGERYKNIADRLYHRWGKTGSEVIMGGKKVILERGRVRAKAKGREKELATILDLKDHDILTEKQMEQMIIGVSTRKYPRSLEAIPKDTTVYACSKSVVSRSFVAKTKQKLQEWMCSPIDRVYPVLIIDGTAFCNSAVIVCMGISYDGEKKVLGAWHGSTENYEVCKDLFQDLISRGLDPLTVKLAVLDGSKALAKAVRNVFGERTQIQRCQVHKVRNVLSYLPKTMHESVGQAMRQAYKASDYDTAKRLLQNLENSLRKTHKSAASSLAEGMEETLTLLRFQASKSLQKSLASTNIIENLNGTIKHVCRRVKRWRSSDMIMRWVYTGICEAEKKFRRINGYTGLKNLIAMIDSEFEKKSIDKEAKTG